MQVCTALKVYMKKADSVARKGYTYNLFLCMSFDHSTVVSLGIHYIVYHKYNIIESVEHRTSFATQVFP